MLIPVSNEVKTLLNDSVSFAHKIGKEHSLLQLLFRLAHGYHNNGREYVCLLNRDFCSHSFGFSCWDLKDITIEANQENAEIVYTIHTGAKPWMVGGLIYHGGNEETFAVEMNPSDGWSIHT